MRHFKKHLSLSLMISGASMLGGQAYAADQNTYRSGSPYLKTIASHFSQCERQCGGDAQCRGWNFVRPNAGSATGVCEFNSEQATPVSSSVSMSGTMNTQIDPTMNNVVQAGTNTIRIGTPNLNIPQRTVRQNRAPSQRKIVRKPVPRQINAQKSNYKQPVNIKPSLRKPQARPHQNMPQDKPATRQAPKSNQQQRVQKPVQKQATIPATHKLTPEQAYYRDQYLAQKRQQGILQQQQKRQYQQRQQPVRRQPVRQRPNEQRPQLAPTNRRPIPYAQRPQLQQQPQQQQFRPQQRAPQSPLYGSLYDDLTKNMTQVPRPKTAPDNLKNPNAPLATSRAMPTKPVVTKPLTTPAIPDLVGG